MKKALLIFMSVLPCVTVHMGAGAVTVKKAASVAVQETPDSGVSAASVLPTVLNLVSGIQQLNQQQKELTAECEPSSQEIAWVDNMVKEWAKTGSASAEDVKKSLKRSPCAKANGGYADSVRINAGTKTSDICYDSFAGTGNVGMVWENFPKVGKASYCSDGSLTCSDKSKKTASDIYDIFNLIDFTEADYSPSELSMASKLMAKIEKCSYARLSAKKREAWGNFVVGTLGTVGQKTNTSTIMQSVSAISNSNGFSGGMSSLGAIAQQFLDK